MTHDCHLRHEQAVHASGFYMISVGPVHEVLTIDNFGKVGIWRR